MADIPGLLRETPSGSLLLRVHVQPKASRDAVLPGNDDRLRVRLTAPPVDGAANKALCALLAKMLGVPKSHLAVVAGQKSREKTVCIDHPDTGVVRTRLKTLQAAD